MIRLGFPSQSIRIKLSSNIPNNFQHVLDLQRFQILSHSYLKQISHLLIGQYTTSHNLSPNSSATSVYTSCYKLPETRADAQIPDTGSLHCVARQLLVLADPQVVLALSSLAVF